MLKEVFHEDSITNPSFLEVQNQDAINKLRLACFGLSQGIYKSKIELSNEEYREICEKFKSTFENYYKALAKLAKAARNQDLNKFQKSLALVAKRMSEVEALKVYSLTDHNKLHTAIKNAREDFSINYIMNYGKKDEDKSYTERFDYGSEPSKFMISFELVKAGMSDPEELGKACAEISYRLEEQQRFIKEAQAALVVGDFQRERVNFAAWKKEIDGFKNLVKYESFAKSKAFKKNIEAFEYYRLRNKTFELTSDFIDTHSELNRIINERVFLEPGKMLDLVNEHREELVKMYSSAFKLSLAHQYLFYGKDFDAFLQTEFDEIIKVLTSPVKSYDEIRDYLKEFVDSKNKLTSFATENELVSLSTLLKTV